MPENFLQIVGFAREHGRITIGEAIQPLQPDPYHSARSSDLHSVLSPSHLLPRSELYSAMRQRAYSRSSRERYPSSRLPNTNFPPTANCPRPTAHNLPALDYKRII